MLSVHINSFKMKQSTIEILHSMGYREMANSGKFGKPIAYSLFLVVFADNTIVWQNRFKNDNEILVWNSIQIAEDEFTIEFSNGKLKSVDQFKEN